MFQRAVVRLTLWYLAVIALLSAFFSVALYNVSTRELNALERRQESLLSTTARFNVPPEFKEFNEMRLQQIQDSKSNIAVNLAYFNLFILIGGGALSYFLARRTLSPIEASVEAQNRFTADASHELRTPLTAMRTELEVALRDQELNLGDSKKLHESTLEEIAKLETLTNGLLKLSHHDSRKQQEAFHDTSLKEVIDEAVKRVAQTAKQRDVTIHTEVRDGTVHGDAWSLSELVAILLDNAIKYSEHGSSVAVTARITRHQGLITVRDSGVGIDASHLPHIFDRFYRADTSRTNGATEGYGLGLSLAKKIAELHGGTIEVKSVLGKGSAFTVVLPQPYRLPSSPSKHA